MKLLAQFQNSTYLSHDSFYYPFNSTYYNYIPEVDSFNYDVISAINLPAFYKELEQLINTNAYEYIFLDGILLYEDIKFASLLDKKFFLYLNKYECLRRRMTRKYSTASNLAYFEKCVWTEYSRYKTFVEKTFPDVVYIDGSKPKDEVFQLVLNNMKEENITNQSEINQKQNGRFFL